LAGEQGGERWSGLAEMIKTYRALFEQLAEASPDNSVMLPFSIWREAFINDADLDVARASYEQFSPEPYQQMTEPLDLRKFYTLDTQDVQPARAVPAGPNAGQPRGYLLRSKRPGRQDY
jgi:hypothetical protein